MKTTTDVPPNFGAWLRYIRLIKGLSRPQLIQKSGVSRRRINDIELGIVKTLTEKVIIGLGRPLGMNYFEMVEQIKRLGVEYDKSKPRIDDFESLLKSFSELDDYIRQPVRSIDDAAVQGNPILTRNTYRDILFSQVSQRYPVFQHPLPDFSTFLTKSQILKPVVESLPKEDLTVKVDDDLRKIEFLADGGRLTLEYPELLWDCCCSPSSESPSKNCRIHSHELGEIVSKSFSKNVKIVYKDFDFYWKDLDALWPPSIDSFYLIDNIINNTDLITNPDGKIVSIMDIGAGTGFLGIILSHLIDGIERLCLTDWSTASYLYSSINWFINSGKSQRGRTPSYQFRVAANTYWDYEETKKQEEEIFDLVICNPPYLPIPNKFRGLRAEQTTAGTELLKHVIERCGQLGNTVIIQFSNLAKDKAEQAAKRAGVQLQPIGKPNQIPFRIPFALKNRKYLEWLLDEEGEGKDKPWALTRNEKRDSKKMTHQYYHYIQSYYITP